MAGWDDFKPDSASSAPPVKASAWDSFVPDSSAPSGPPKPDMSSPAAAEIRRKAVEGGGTDMSDPLIENLTVGIGTAGLVPGLAAVPTGIGYAGKTLGGRILGAGIGTAEQYLGGWLSEKGAQLGGQAAGTPGAIAGGLIAPTLGGAAEAGLAGGAMRAVAPLTHAEEGVAQRAAAGAE